MDDALLQVNIEDKITSKIMSLKNGKYRVHNVLPYRIRKSLLRGENFVGILTGKTRSGKSFSALTLCNEVDPNFSVDNVVFSTKEFMDLLASGKLKSGSMIIWDEAGVGISAREWYSLLNKSLNYVLQTWGHQNIGLILTVPDFSFVDSQTRKLVNMLLNTVKLVRSENKAVLKGYYISPMEKGEIKRVRPRYSIGGKKLDIEYIEIKKPPVKLVNAYLKKKENFTATLNKGVMLEIQQLEEKKEKDVTRTISDFDMMEQAWIKLKDHIKIINGKRKLSAYIVKKELGITMSRANYVRQELLIKAKKEDYPLLESEKIYEEIAEELPKDRLNPENFL